MTKIFKTPFAETGDKISPPDAVQPDGSVSYALGYGFDYQRDTSLDGGVPVDPLAKVFPREQHNGILNDITGALGEIQANGLTIWQSIGGPYPINALVRYAGSNWRSTVVNNATTPGDPGASWVDASFQPYATESVPGIIKISTQPQVDAGLDDQTSVTPKKLLVKINQALEQKLPFAPVEQGGGAGMAANKVRIGAGAGSTLLAQIDSTQLGSILFAAPGDCVITSANTAPPGTMKANGSAVSRTTYAALFARIGTTYGAGNGSTTFNLPDGRAEFIRGWDDARGVDAGRVMGSSQADSVRSIGIFSETGNPFGGGGGTGAGYLKTANSGAVIIPAGTETRGRNIAFLICIRY